MAYIYQITNDINNKIYIGKTEQSIEKRWKEHCADYNKERNENRPLYAAMKKYGIEHFHIQCLEETDMPNEREVYWIEQKQSFKYGYNATLGGDGKRYLDYDLIYSAYQALGTIKETATKLNISPDTVSKVVKQKGLVKSAQEINKDRLSKAVKMYNAATNEYIQSFSSLTEAAQFVKDCGHTDAKDLKGVAAHIRKCANGERKTAYHYIWKWQTV